MPEINKILVIRLSSLGDIILSFPLLKKLKEKFPGVQIHFLTKKVYKEAADLSGLCDSVIIFEDISDNAGKKVSEGKYDMILDLHKNPRTMSMTLFKKNVRRYRKENFKKFLLVNLRINLFKKIKPVYRKYLETINDHLEAADFEFYSALKDMYQDRILKGRYVVIAPSSRHFTKTYPADRYITYIKKLQAEYPDVQIVLTGDSSGRDMQICRYIGDECSNIINMCGKTDLSGLASLINYSEYVVCNDSAILHLAEALGKKVRSVFGSTVEEFGFFPQLKDSVVFQVAGLPCRPCTHIGRDSCPEKHFKCMKLIELK